MRRFKRQLSQKLRLRDDSQERHSNWLGIFYDLIFMAAILQLSAQLSREYDIDELGRYALLFVPIWWAWCDHNFFMARFDVGDIIQRLVTLSGIFGVVMMAIAIPDTFDDADATFIAAYVSTRAATFFQYIRAGQTIPEAKELTGKLTQGYGIALIMWLVAIAVPAPSSYVMWGIALSIEFLTPVFATKEKDNVKFPANFTQLRERFGVFTIIVLGTTVATIIRTISLRRLSIIESAIAASFGLIVIFGIWWDYYESSRFLEPSKTKVNTTNPTFWQWTYSHLPLHASIPVIAIGFRYAINTFPGDFIDYTTGWVLALAVAGSMFALGIIWASIPILAQKKSSNEAASYFVTAGVVAGCGILAERVVVPLYLFCLTGMFLVRVLMTDIEFDSGESSSKDKKDNKSGSSGDKRDSGDKKEEKRQQF
ncbi:MAG: low temperature requirement protein A [Methylacidiphilales bacterium]|nr:low temperature requirement protein A [Candidatus Methylacidiphilales bacterium]